MSLGYPVGCSVISEEAPHSISHTDPKANAFGCHPPENGISHDNDDGMSIVIKYYAQNSEFCSSLKVVQVNVYFTLWLPAFLETSVVNQTL